MNIVYKITPDNRIESNPGCLYRTRIICIFLHIVKVIVFNEISSVNGFLKVMPPSHRYGIAPPRSGNVIVRNSCKKRK